MLTIIAFIVVFSLLVVLAYIFMKKSLPVADEAQFATNNDNNRHRVNNSNNRGNNTRNNPTNSGRNNQNNDNNQNNEQIIAQNNTQTNTQTYTEYDQNINNDNQYHETNDNTTAIDPNKKYTKKEIHKMEKKKMKEDNREFEREQRELKKLREQEKEREFQEKEKKREEEREKEVICLCNKKLARDV